MTTWPSGVSESNGIAIHYRRTGGAGTPVLMLHGLTGSGACWTPLARQLEGHFDVLMPDARGHGASTAPPQGYRYDDHARDVESLISSVNMARPVLLGHSMGGMTAAVVASRGAAALRGVVLVDPTFLSAERQREVYESDVAAQHERTLGRSRAAFAAELRARHPRRSQEIIDILVEARLRTCRATFDVLAPPNPPYRDVVSAIDVPILLVIGDRTVVTIEMAAELRELNSRVRVARLRDAGHGLPFDAPERLGAVVAPFLHELASGCDGRPAGPRAQSSSDGCAGG